MSHKREELPSSEKERESRESSLHPMVEIEVSEGEDDLPAHVLL